MTEIVIDRLATIRGVVAIILFGSVARGEDDEYSDLDLLVVFKDRSVLWKGWDQVFKETGSINLSLHAIPETIDELRNSNPVFLEELEKYGRVLYSRTPFDFHIGDILLRPFSIISYNIASLPYKAKMRVMYRLYGKEGKGGTLRGDGGLKLGNGCVMVPQDAGRVLLEYLKSNRAKVSKIEVLIGKNNVTKAKRSEFLTREVFKYGH